MRRAVVAAACVAAAVTASACGERRPSVPRGVAVQARPAVEEVDAGEVVHPDELEPGTIRAYGLLMPVGTVERFATPSTKIFYVQAPMSRVMRYLQRRLEITTAEIHPLGAMVRGARLRTPASGSESLVVDVGVRAEGERTLVTLWNRSNPPAPARTMSDGLRAAGFDPRTGRPLPENNH